MELWVKVGHWYAIEFDQQVIFLGLIESRAFLANSSAEDKSRRIFSLTVLISDSVHSACIDLFEHLEAKPRKITMLTLKICAKRIFQKRTLMKNDRATKDLALVLIVFTFDLG